MYFALLYMFLFKAGEIKIGGLCFEVQGDKSIYARKCDSTNPNQQWVYDGTRIRRAQDPTVSDHDLNFTLLFRYLQYQSPDSTVPPNIVVSSEMYHGAGAGSIDSVA